MLDTKRLEQLRVLQEKIDIYFKNIDILNIAFLHPSYINESNDCREDNQRLEFLGDAVLELIISDYLYKNYPHLDEGQMTKVRAQVVCEQSLFEISSKLSLGKFLLLGKGEEITLGRHKPSILADTFEALIGALYLEKGFERTYKFILENFENPIKTAVDGQDAFDYKTRLQEILQRTSPEPIKYKIVDEKGPDHDKIFYATVYWRKRLLGRGLGKTKKQAEQQAAKDALKDLNSRL